MTSITKYACALALAGGLACPALAAQAGSGPTTGATSTNDAGSGPTKGAATNSATNSQSNSQTPGQKGETANAASPADMQIAQKLRADLMKAGYTDITIRPSSFFIQAKNSEGNPVTMMISPDSVTALTEASQRSANNSQHTGGTANSAGVTPGPASTGGSQPVTPATSSKP